MSVEFKDFSINVKAKLDDLGYSVLEEVAGEVESQVKRNTAVDTGKTKNSWTHKLSVSDDACVATIGSPEENAIWEEFGTGDYALNGDGRKGGWAYQDPKTGETIWTHGKHPRRAFYRAYVALRDKIIKHIQDVFKGGLS